MNCSTVRSPGAPGGPADAQAAQSPSLRAGPDDARGSAPMIHVGLLRGLCEQLESQGIDVSAALEWADCDWRTLCADRDWICELPLHWIVLGLQRHGLTPAALRRAWADLPMQHFGTLASSLAAAPLGRDALATLHQHVCERWPTVDSRLEVAEGGLIWSLHMQAPAGELRRFLLEGLTGCCTRLLAQALGTVPEPRDIGPGSVAWHIDDERLDRVRPNGPAAAFDAAWPEDDLPHAAASLAARVDELLGETDHGGDIERIAHALGIAPRTLSRRLARAGLSFQTLLENWRKRHGKELLDRGDVPMAEVARRLGYRSVSNFSRSARRWAGRGTGRPDTDG